MSRERSEIDAWLDAFVRAPAFLGATRSTRPSWGRMQPVADPSVKRMAVSVTPAGSTCTSTSTAFLERAAVPARRPAPRGAPRRPRAPDVTPASHGSATPELMDLAVEMSANEYIEEPLPDPITWQPYASLGLRAGQSTLERYERLEVRQAARRRPHSRRARRARASSPTTTATSAGATPSQALSSRPGSSSHARRRRLASNTPGGSDPVAGPALRGEGSRAA
jgi:hypothetical protein